MVPFNLTIELQNVPSDVLVEQMDRLADEDGFIRFDVTVDERRSVIYVNVENDLPPATLQDAEADFEAVNYPEQLAFYSEDEVFSGDEVQMIGKAIQNYNRELRVHFNRLMSRP